MFNESTDKKFHEGEELAKALSRHIQLASMMKYGPEGTGDFGCIFNVFTAFWLVEMAQKNGVKEVNQKVREAMDCVGFKKGDFECNSSCLIPVGKHKEETI